MSYDLLLRNRCTHQLTDIDLELDLSTLQDLRIPYPVGSRRDFTLLANGFSVREGDSGQFAYVLSNDELTPIRNRLKVHFLKPIRSLEFFFRANFTTAVEGCPRCHSLEVENDIREDGRGEFEEVRNENKLKQEVERHETVERISMLFHPEIGTDLQSLIGKKGLSPGTLQAARLQMQIRNALENLQRLQRVQRSYQDVSSGELLREINSIRASRDELEPTMYLIIARLKALSGGDIEVRKLIESKQFREKIVS